MRILDNSRLQRHVRLRPSRAISWRVSPRAVKFVVSTTILPRRGRRFPDAALRRRMEQYIDAL